MPLWKKLIDQDQVELDANNSSLEHLRDKLAFRKAAEEAKVRKPVITELEWVYLTMSDDLRHPVLRRDFQLLVLTDEGTVRPFGTGIEWRKYDCVGRKYRSPHVVAYAIVKPPGALKEAPIPNDPWPGHF